MKKSQNNLTDAEILRQKAEEQLKKQQSKVSSLSSENDLRKLAHELQVHQIELEMQYEQLKQAKEEADAATQKYTELYDFAPLGFFTLSKLGEIIGLNLHGAVLLGKERLRLINRRFGSSVSDQTKSIFNNFLDKVFTSKIIESCEVTLTTGGKNAQTNVYLTGHVLENGEQCLISVVDITEHKKAVENLRRKDEHHRAVIENIFRFVPEGLLVFTRKLNLMKQNKAFEEIVRKYAERLGYTQEELAEKIIEQLRGRITSGDTTEIRIPEKGQ
jgi:nitrogen fixation/metabolism regulation signal transduction histidine kinase